MEEGAVLLVVCVCTCVSFWGSRDRWHLQAAGWGGLAAFIWRTCFWFTLRAGGELNTTGPLTWCCFCSALVVGLVLLGKGPKPGWSRASSVGWEPRPEQEVSAGAVGHRVTTHNMRECPRGKRRRERSCESKSGSETRSWRLVLSLVLERVSVALAQALDSSAAGWKPPSLNFKQSWALLRLPAPVLTLHTFNPPCPRSSRAILLPVAHAGGVGSQATGGDGEASRGGSGGKELSLWAQLTQGKSRRVPWSSLAELWVGEV